MAPRILQRLTAWFSLVLVLATAMTPARGFVLCIEADGCVSVELKAPDADCSGCDGHEEIASAAQFSSDGCEEIACACTDLAVPGVRHEQRAESRTFQLHASSWATPIAPVHVTHFAATAEPVRGPPLVAPRVAESLGHIRSIVLLV